MSIEDLLKDDMFKPNKEFDKAREKANKDILKIINSVLREHPTLRFGQVLLSLKVVLEDEIFAATEPTEVLKRIKSTDIYKRLDSQGKIK